MMLSPEAFKVANESKTLEECYQIRKEIMEDILRYEYNEVPSTEYRILPSPETIYNMNNLYLMKICELEEPLLFIQELQIVFLRSVVVLLGMAILTQCNLIFKRLGIIAQTSQPT